MSKLYLIVRSDLSPAQQAVQAAHALRQWSADHPELDRHWFETSNTLALLCVDSEQDLGIVWDKATRLGVPVSAFHEPDRGNEMTAIAIGPQGKKLTRNLALALKC